MDCQPIICVEHLSKAYKLYDNKGDRLREAVSVSRKQYHKLFFALNDVSFSVNRGETLGIIGTNGSGKSTLLKILSGVVSPTSGHIKVLGRVSALLELGAGFNPEYTGLENIMLHGTMMGYSKEELGSREKEIIRFADIGEFINQPVKNYSSGMFARLAFAVAINVEPEVLIVDEILSVGDIRFQIKCMNKMKEMMKSGTTILFVSHDISSVRRFCPKSIWIDRGILREAGETNLVADEYEDFLRCAEAREKKMIQQEEKNEKSPPTQTKDGSIAKILDVAVLTFLDQPVESVAYDEPVTVSVTYDVYDKDVTAPVLGVALFSIDDDYICGLNTLLDSVVIPWKLGRNRLFLQYPQGLRVLGGKYYFDVTLRDQTATVNIDYQKKVKNIQVNSGYVAEGRLVLPHRWEQPTHSF
ncbi:ABC transporter ATP-binding protein [Caproicibacter fermentans]|uniref:ABC transporter ATP-binding protein n=1 Tax=Caproicibacter fermentans TaxID=2576756 RepID=A0A7G8TFM9_9FIRM|nr:ABC transporter ATP-binding protein [Caproicibacter fermentans]QNK42420.1 ABC transporter ATP-binding protein [Caproicibacter fermentans]